MRKGEQSTFLGYAHDYSWGEFIYCKYDKAEINSFSSDKNLKLVISCYEHQNDEAITKGQASITLDLNKDLKSLKTEGFVKKLFWKKEIDIECNNLKKDE